MIKKKIRFISIILILLCVSCSESDNPLTLPKPVIHYPTSPGFVTGEVSVEFQDSVNAVFIRSFINDFKLTPINITADSSFSVWIQVDSGQVNNYFHQIQQDTAVVRADLRNYNLGDPQKLYIIAYFKGTVKINYALSLIHSIGGISWKATNISMRLALIGVPIGQEQFWASVFMRFSFVKNAVLLYIEYIFDVNNSSGHGP